MFYHINEQNTYTEAKICECDTSQRITRNTRKGFVKGDTFDEVHVKQMSQSKF